MIISLIKKLNNFIKITLFLVPLLIYSTFVLAAETVVYSQGFEANNGGYSVTGNAGWDMGSPGGSVGPTTAHNGSYCWGTVLNGTLPRPSDGSIISPAISVPNITSGQVIRVRFWAWVAIDGMRDRGEFFISKDGTSWQSRCQFYQSMSDSSAATPGWKLYDFSIDDSYSNGPLYLRFRAAVSNSSPSFYCGGSNDLAGFYIDDVAITITDVTGDKKKFSLEAWEDPSTWASCPWVAPWDGTKYENDNDIYSVARNQSNEYTDSYKLLKPLVATNGVYPIEVIERDEEISYTDYVALQVIDHAKDVAVAPDDKGKIIAYKPSLLSPPSEAISGDGKDVFSLVSSSNDKGFAAYSNDTLYVRFDGVDVSKGAVLFLRVAGFIEGEGAYSPYTGQPAIIVETKDTNGQWQERGRLKPRFAYSVAAFDLSAYLTAASQSVNIRLRSISHANKYHSIDYVALYNGPQPSYRVATVSPSSAVLGNANILGKLLTPDNNYVQLTPGQNYTLKFHVVPQGARTTREFVFISKGYYIPTSGTYLIYTWDGSNWVMRDAYSYPGSDFTKEFDLSLFLPDPDGDYKIRVWQDYQYEPAGLDYVGMNVGNIALSLEYAWDLKKNQNIFSMVQSSDNVRDEFNPYTCPRNRVIDLSFTPVSQNIPPTACPVMVNTTTSNPTISWTYFDADNDPQTQYEVQVWEGPGGAGINVWNPPVGTGNSTSVVYNGPALINGKKYYVRVRLFDGMDWGQWCETDFTIIKCKCDVDNNGIVNIDDINIIKVARGTTNPLLDIDGDGIVTVNDARKCVIQCTKPNCAR